MRATDPRGPSAAIRRRKGISSRPRMPRVRRVVPRVPHALVFKRNSAPAFAARSAISRSRRHRSTTYAFVTPASKRSSPPRSETIRAPVTSFKTDLFETSHSANADAERRPAHCTGWPIVPCSSIQSVESPPSAQARAAALPAGPAPTTTTSQTRLSCLADVGSRRPGACPCGAGRRAGS